jgi:hypothetical protein
MTEVAGLTFRFQHPSNDIIGLFVRRLAPHDQDRVLRIIEPLLMQRDRQMEDAITRALACTCGSH